MPVDSSLSVDEKASLSIDRFIFHVIIKDETAPRFMTEVVLPNAATKEFFRQRIAEAAEGTQYVFLQPPSEQKIKTCCAQMLLDHAAFVSTQQSIASHFLNLHSGSTSSGVLIVALISIMHRGSRLQMVSLLKMDHQQVLRYIEEPTADGIRATIEQIANTFVEDKRAVQKSALIDVGNTFTWDVLAEDRNGREDGITDYFRKFLDVQPHVNNSSLTRMAVTAVRQWSSALDVFPPGEDAASYRIRAHQYLSGADTFDTTAFINFVVRDENPDRKNRMSLALHDTLAHLGVAGQRFRPIPSAVVNARQVRMKTNLGVKLEWEGSAIDRGVKLPSEIGQDGFYHIEIITSEDPKKQV